MKKSFKFVFIAMVALMLAGTANALPITGDIGMIGWGLSSIDPMTATEIPGPLPAFVTGVTGDFDDYLDTGDYVIFSSFTFDPLSSPTTLWSAGGFTFALSSITVDSFATQLVLSGVGSITGHGFDPTTGTWGMTIDALSTSFSFSSGTTAVPEPTATLLLGIGLATLVVICRKKYKKKLL